MNGEQHEPPLGAAPSDARIGEIRIEDPARRRIGQNLRLLYASVLSQPLPERFTRLLDELSATPPTQDGRDREGSP